MTIPVLKTLSSGITCPNCSTKLCNICAAFAECENCLSPLSNQIVSMVNDKIATRKR